MAVPPLGADPDAAFAQLHEVHADLMRVHPGAGTLSAGMTGDLESAVRHGRRACVSNCAARVSTDSLEMITSHTWNTSHTRISAVDRRIS